MQVLPLLLLTAVLQAAGVVQVRGIVRDATGLPLAGAIVEVNATLMAVSDDKGEFEMEVGAGSPSSVAVRLPGFEPYESVIDPRSRTTLEVVLKLGGIRERVTVAVPDPTKAVERTFAVDPLQVYRTPGAQADLFRALQTLPGVSTPDEATGLFVRGGDVSEARVLLDDAVMAHPYRYETPTGGFRGAVDPFLISGLTFSTGAFSARHGNALSAIVDLHGLEQPQVRELNATFGLAGVSASFASPVSSRVGIRAAANRTLTTWLFAVNGSPRRFDPPPEGWDGSAALTWNLGSAGRMKAFVLAQSDDIGVETEQDAFTGFLHASSRHGFYAARWDGAIAKWPASASLGVDTYTQSRTAGVLDIDVTDRVESWRIELSSPRVEHVTWRFGVNGSLNDALIDGFTPSRGGDFAGVGGTRPFDASVSDSFTGTYVEATTTAGRLAVTVGSRLDRFTLAKSMTIDPRLNVRIALGASSALRLASGLFHQAPAPMFYDQSRGAPDLVPMRATHYVAGYETGRENEGLYLRVEAYLKKYDQLPLVSFEPRYESDGYGSAHGIDLFGRWLSSRLELRGSASWLQARRRWTPLDQRDRYSLPNGTWPADFEIPWSVQFIATVPLSRTVSSGISWHSASGRPDTPIVGNLQTPDGFLPVFGGINSDRLPRYERLDLSVSKLVPVGSGVVILFASVDNALGRDNFFRYAYSADFSSRHPVTSTSPRSVFVGITLRR